MKVIKKLIISAVSVCMTLGLITAKTSVYAIEEVTDKLLYEETDAYILEEDESLREESSKSFLMSDGSTQKVIYSLPVHYESEGEWSDVDNTLISDESGDIKGYKNKEGKNKIKFSKKIHKSNMASVTDGDYKMTWGFEDFTNRSEGITTEYNKTSDNIIEQAYNNVSSSITYSDVMDDMDLTYHIDSLSVKEDIVLKKYNQHNTFTFNYKVKDVELILNDNGDIEASDEAGNIVFTMPKPYMYDSNEVYSDDAYYELESDGGNKYTVRIVVDDNWLKDEERIYPVVIDPIITTETSQSAIDTTFVTSDKPTANYSTKMELLVGKESSEYGNCRTLVKFTLPALNRGDVVTDASLNMALYKKNFYASSTPDLQINAHMATSSWAYNTVTWNSKPSYEDMVLDYDYIRRADTNNVANWKVFDITSAVKRWYEGTSNNGIVLKSYNESGTYADTGVKGYLWPERYNSTEKCYPYIVLTYRNLKGLEDYWDYDSIATYSSGTAHINTYSGNLVVEHQDASTAGEKLPMYISHIYNGYMAKKNMIYAKPYTGYGWKLNVQMTLKSSSYYGLTGQSASVFPYVFMDSDGTEHYFINTDDGYKDEDGLNLTLEVITGGYTITDKNDTVMTFNSSGNITSIKDRNNNTITYTYENDYIKKITDGNGQKLELTYDANGYLTEIEDHASRVTSFTYENNYLTEITYPDGKISRYEYDSDGALTSMISYDNTSLNFTYSSLSSGKKVTSVTEKAGSVSGQTIRYTRNTLNVTEVETSGVDNIIDTADDVTTELQYDDGGRLKTVHSSTSDKELGSTSVEYSASSPNSSYSNISYLNKLTKYGNSNGIAHNIMMNHSGESLDRWKKLQSLGNATFSIESTDEEYLFGAKSIKMNATYCQTPIARSRMYEDFGTKFVQAGKTYTASAYIKTKDIEGIEGAETFGAAVIIYINAPSMPDDVDGEAADFSSEFITGTTDEAINGGWRRVSVTFTTPEDVSYVRFNCVIRGATGTAYFDGIQLEAGDSVSPYNMVENGSFERTTDSFPDFWSKGTNITSSDKSVSDESQHGARSMKFSSSVGVKRNIYQDIYVNGKASDTYIISGWGYGKAVKQINDDRKFKVSIRVTYTDGSTNWIDFPLEFNTSVSGWQYCSKMFNLADDTDTKKVPSVIRLYLMDYNQANICICQLKTEPL